MKSLETYKWIKTVIKYHLLFLHLFKILHRAHMHYAELIISSLEYLLNRRRVEFTVLYILNTNDE